MTDPRPDAPSQWWRSAVLYQVYIRSFADGDGDGLGDLRGLLGKLDHLSWLGVDALWLSPVGPSPNADWGYDVADYTDVHEDYGSLADLDELIAAAGRIGIRVMLDLVPNHTSDHHAWFVDSRSSRRVRAPRLVRVGRCPRRRLAAQQLGEHLRRPGVDPRPCVGAVLPAQLPARAARPQLVVRGGARRLRRHPALLVGPRHRRVPHRRVQHDRQGRRAARQPARHRRRPVHHADVGPAPLYNCNRPEVHDVLRRWRGVSGGYEPKRVLLGETNVEYLEHAGVVLRPRRRRAPSRLQLPVHRGGLRGQGDSGHRRAHRGAAPARGVAGVDRLEPRRVAPVHTLGAGRPRQGAPGPPDAAHPARHPRAVPGRRDRPHRRRAHQGASSSTRWGRASGPTTRAGTPSAHPCRGTARQTPASPPPG